MVVFFAIMGIVGMTIQGIAIALCVGLLVVLIAYLPEKFRDFIFSPLGIVLLIILILFIGFLSGIKTWPF